MAIIPDSLKLTLEREIQERKKSVKAIKRKQELQIPLGFIVEAAEIIIRVCCLQNLNRDRETLTILGYRLSNNLIVASNMMLTGWWQNVAMIMRDILETIYLLYYFEIDRTKMEKWRTASRKERLKEFWPSNIRKVIKNVIKKSIGESEKLDALDKRYSYYSELGSHPTFSGCLQAFYKEGVVSGLCFFDEDRLTTYLLEVANLSGLAVDAFVRTFGERDLPRDIQSDFSNRLSEGKKWERKHPGLSYSEVDLA